MDASGSSSEAPLGRLQKPGPWPHRIEPFVPRTDHNPRELKSWARRTGFDPNLSGETSSVISDRDTADEPQVPARLDLENGIRRRGDAFPRKAEIEPAMGRGRIGAEDRGVEIGPAPAKVEKEKRKVTVEPLGVGIKNERREVGNELLLRVKSDEPVRNGHDNGAAPVFSVKADEDPKAEARKDERGVEIDFSSDDQEPEDPSGYKQPSDFRSTVTDNPGITLLMLYGIQHYLSLAGSLVFTPLIMVPAMGGTDEETAAVISTMLLVSGVTTIMHSYFGSRLPLVQGSSFVYLAPALVIINSEEYRNLNENKFKHIMRELQGAVVVGSVFQAVLGYSGLMSLLLRLINPVVVAPTVAAVGLAYFSYAFPQAGNCVEISIPLILLILIFTLYLRRLSLFGNHLFLIYAVPFCVAIVWAYAFFLTAGGVYNYKGCNSNVPSSNILTDGCRKHVTIMKHCRTDVSNAWKTAAWVRVPYPFQWGSPTFHFKTSFIMVIISLVASVDSIGSYHATSLLVNLKPPTPGIVSRGIGMEGLASILAGLWGTGTGSVTLTENIHTLDATKMASQKALELGAVPLILFSFVGKVGALLASIPLALVASVLCFTWALIVALGLSTLQYTQTRSSRNIIIVGFTLFISLSVPAYFQHYEPNSILILPSYLLPYGAASSGPVHTSSEGFNFALNALLSLNMVVALIVAFILDNTVPGSKQERGVYIWSDRGTLDFDSASLEPYALPANVRPLFRWAKWVG
ncbi:nucleobase-ascorbate transporter 11-like isoform X1 [Zingiber officinale]|uniref:nucleobase-ascorbate transporter 11-like isoform X1 n=1 Tax=Zingiber officinale TaxID=94328 RepID=UPI001C4C2F86|nr:nucleobase-ascorbate transporter 11-like isoform X1 [Zingiber officinale]